MASSAPLGRLALFDNAKLFLIVLVVIGHCIDMGATKDHDMAQAMFVFIYSFHMPLFIFLAGLFVSRQKLTAHKTLEKVIEYSLYGIALKIFLCAVRVLVGRDPTFSLFVNDGIEWFCFALAAFQALAYLLRDVDGRVIGVFSVILALAVGYDSSISGTLNLSRIIVFFPFFWLGVLLDPKKIYALASKRSIKAIGCVVAIAFLLLCMTQTTDIYEFRALFTGRNSYEAVSVFLENCGWMHRLLAYAMSLIVGAAVLCAIPCRPLGILTKWGGRTLQVYFFHFGVIYVIAALGFFEWGLSFPHGWLLFVVAGVAIALALCPKVFGVPLEILARGARPRTHSLK